MRVNKYDSSRFTNPLGDLYNPRFAKTLLSLSVLGTCFWLAYRGVQWLFEERRDFSSEPSATRVAAGFPEFWHRSHVKHRPYFEASVVLEPIINQIRQYSPANPLQKIVRRLTLIGANSYGALVVLTVNGYGNDAMKIARSIFEADVTAGYLRRNPEELGDYLDYYWIQQKKLYDYISTYCPEKISALDPLIIEQVHQRYNEVAERFKGRNGWCKKRIRQMAEELDEGLDQLYLTFYSWASDMNHLSVRGLTLQVEKGSLDVDLAPSEKWLEGALEAGLGSMLRLTMRSNEELGLGLDKDIDKVARIYGEAIGSA